VRAQDPCILVARARAAARAPGTLGRLRFWRRGLLEAACDGLAIDLQLACNSALGPALAMQGQNNVYHGHFEVIRHGVAPGKRGPRKPTWRIRVSSSVASFEAPLGGWF
jgi:hypothetical protein